MGTDEYTRRLISTTPFAQKEDIQLEIVGADGVPSPAALTGWSGTNATIELACLKVTSNSSSPVGLWLSLYKGVEPGFSKYLHFIWVAHENPWDLQHMNPNAWQPAPPDADGCTLYIVGSSSIPTGTKIYISGVAWVYPPKYSDMGAPPGQSP